MKSFVILLLAAAWLGVTNTSDQDKRSLLVSDLGISSYNLSNAGHSFDFSTRVSEADDSSNTLMSAYPSGLKYKSFYKENIDNTIISSKLVTLAQPIGFVSGINVLPTLARDKIKRFARRELSDILERNVPLSYTTLRPIPRSGTTRPLSTTPRTPLSIFSSVATTTYQPLSTTPRTLTKPPYPPSPPTRPPATRPPATRPPVPTTPFFELITGFIGSIKS